MALSDNLISYYKLDGNSNDAKGSANGSDTNITYSSGNGKIVQGAGFGGSSIIQTANGTMQQATAMSISFWVKITTLNDPYLMVWGNTNASANEFNINLGSNKINLSTTGGGGFSGATALSSGTWYHIVAVNNGASSVIYLNGASDGTGTLNTFSFNAGISMGNNFGFGTHLTGAIDEVGFWTRALTSGDVTALYNGGAGLAYPFSTAYTLTAANGSYALTGNTVSFPRKQIIVAANGSYALTGNVVTLSRGKGMVAQNGAYVLTGNIAGMTSARHMAAVNGSYALTGNNISFQKGHNLIAISGAYILTGFAAILRRRPVRLNSDVAKSSTSSMVNTSKSSRGNMTNIQQSN